MTKYLTPKTVLGTVALTLLLGVISSALWDFLFKPGITEFGRVLLTVVTFGSATVRDFTYASAALDPTPLPALFVVLLMSWAPLVVASVQVGKMTGRRSASKSIEYAEKISSGDDEKFVEIINERVSRLQGRINWLTSIFFVISVVISLTAGAVINQSVAVWRVFHADLAICSPYMTSLEEKQFHSRFASMTTRAEYLGISKDLQQIAANSGIKLASTQLW